jgi:glycosyltransferase involved in cell wall biosynthesis
VRELAPDVLHSHGYKANILLGPTPRRWRGPMLATLHGWTSTRRFSRMWLYEQLDQWALRHLDAVVVVARHMLDLPALRGVNASRRWVIENGIPPLAARLDDLNNRGAPPLPRPLVEFTARKPTLIAIGRLSPEKGFTLLVEAFAQARAQSSAAHQLLIVGEGQQRKLLAHRVATLGLSDAVRLAGYVEGADRLLQHAAGFVVSSLTEGLPLVLLEAMQWRVPILATSVGGIPELLNKERRGRLAAPNDLGALSQGLRGMMSPDAGAFEQGVAAAHAAVSQHYTSARMADQYLSAYAEIA